MVFTTETHWPGYAATVPTLGTAAVIMAGFAVVRPGPAALLGTRPFRFVGGLSYSLYLWHWPLLAVAAATHGDLSPWEGLLIVACSAVPAYLTFHLIENPIRYSTAVARSARFALSMGANFTLIGVTAGLTLLLAAGSTGAAPGGREAAGAAVLRDNPRDDPAGAPVDRVDWMTPMPAQATSDVPTEYADGCQQVFAKGDALECTAGDPAGRTTVAVVGDSKATQWLPAIRMLAEQNHWRVVTYLKASCSFSESVPQADGKPYETCATWNREVLARLKAARPDYVITTQGGTKALDENGELSTDEMIAGLRARWSELMANGSRVVVIADNPSPGLNVYECVERNPTRLSACSFPRRRYETSSAAPVLQTAAQGLGVRVVDLFDAICPTERCAPVIGNVLLYRQGSHLTRTYVETLTPRLARALSGAGLRATYRPG
jgi:hypothetical protein